MSAKKQNRWSAEVTHGSAALDLEPGVFTKKSPRQVALSLKRSAERSHHRKGTPFQSAMSLLNFYINRAGSGLSGSQKNLLAHAKEELRQIYHKPHSSPK